MNGSWGKPPGPVGIGTGVGAGGSAPEAGGVTATEPEFTGAETVGGATGGTISGADAVAEGDGAAVSRAVVAVVAVGAVMGACRNGVTIFSTSS